MSPTKKKTPAPKKATAKKAAAKPVKSAKAEKAPARKPAAKPASAVASKKPAVSAATREAPRKPEKATKPEKPTKPEKASKPDKIEKAKIEKVKIEKLEKQENVAAKTSAKAAEPSAKSAKGTDARPTARLEAPAKGKPAAAKKGEDEAAGAGKRTKPKKPIVPTGPRHPKLGFRWGCFRCAAKFYDLGKEEPLCPKCGADQRDRPADEPRAPSESARPRVVRPMAQLLDDDEPVAPMVEDDLGLDDVVEAGDMFEGDGDITHLELDAAELEGETIEAGESDEF